jgi:excinuclease UvrABC helicase subunit UvrB
VPSSEQISASFPHQPNAEQAELFAKLHRFLRSDDGDECFILRGYAGTGKTTVVGALVNALQYYLKIGTAGANGACRQGNHQLQWAQGFYNP